MKICFTMNLSLLSPEEFKLNRMQNDLRIQWV